MKPSGDSYLRGFSMLQTLDKALTPLAWATIIALVILSVFIY